MHAVRGKPCSSWYDSKQKRQTPGGIFVYITQNRVQNQMFHELID